MSKVTDKSFKISFSIARVISGEATVAERRTVDEWLVVSGENKRLFERLQDEKELVRKIELYRTIDKRMAFKEFLREKERMEKVRRQRRINRIFRYAAILLIPLLVGGIYMLQQSFSGDEVMQVASAIAHGDKRAVLRLSDGSAIELGKDNVVLSERNGTMISNRNSGELVYQGATGGEDAKVIYNTLEIPANGEFFMQLSDGSKVWLGACSKLKYPVAFNGKTREIYLEGEAFFEVVKNPDKPFIVKTKGFSVRALGTSFNLMSYMDETFAHTTLKTGKVEVTTREQEKVVLTPGQQAYYSEHGVNVREVDVEVYIAWMGNTFKFDKENIDVILRKIARWYNVHIFYMNENLKNYHFKGTLPKYTDIHDVLELLEQTTNIKFEIKGNTVIVMQDLTRSNH